MASTVRISDSTKVKMQKLIHYLGFKSNQTISQKEMLDILIESGLQNKDKLLKLITRNEENIDWKEDPIFQEVDLELDEDASETVDEVVYGRHHV